LWDIRNPNTAGAGDEVDSRKQIPISVTVNQPGQVTDVTAIILICFQEAHFINTQNAIKRNAQFFTSGSEQGTD